MIAGEGRDEGSRESMIKIAMDKHGMRDLICCWESDSEADKDGLLVLHNASHRCVLVLNEV